MTRFFVPILVSAACLILAVPAVAIAQSGEFGLADQTPPRSPAARALEERLGPEARVTVSAATGTPWNLLRTDRPLTGPSGRAPHRIALDFLRRHRRAFGLSATQIKRLGRPELKISPNGTRHLRWQQFYDGLPVAGADLRAHIAADGRLLAVQGGPLADADPNGNTALKDGPISRRHPRSDAHAELVVAATERGPETAWLKITEPGPDGSEAVLRSAEDGELLARVALGRDASGYANVWDARPTDPRKVIEMPDRWLSSTSALSGDFTYVIAYVMYPHETITDPKGNGGDIPPSTTLEGLPAWDEPYEPIASIYDPVDSPYGGLGCSPLYPCSWSSFRPYSWVTNLRQAAVQAFVYVNRFRDHLAAPPIGFDHQSGGFETHTPGGDDGDPIDVYIMASASLLDGLPPANHLNNGRMNVLPDGHRSQMTLYLFGGDPELPAIDANPAEHAVIVYHEYAHGLTGRIVTDSRGINTMTTLQAGALGEGLSDWYALDYLEATGSVTDDPEIPGEILADADLTAGRLGFRHSAIDCPVGASGAPLCPPGGGFTFAQFAKIERDDEDRPIFDYHADGEIMSQTLWDMRRELIQTYGRDEGIRRARELVTEGLRLLAPFPSFTDMRDGILLADIAAGGADRDLIWRVFARRGMGFGASAYYTETYPEASFALPPSPGPKPDPGPPPAQPPPGSIPGGAAPPPTATAKPRPTRPRLRGRPVFPARALARLRSRAGLLVRVRADANARIVATLDLPIGAAKRYRLGKRLASARIRRLPAGRVGTLRFRLTPRRRLRLKRARTLPLILRIRVDGRDGSGSARTRTFRRTLRG